MIFLGNGECITITITIEIKKTLGRIESISYSFLFWLTLMLGSYAEVAVTPAARCIVNSERAAAAVKTVVRSGIVKVNPRKKTLVMYVYVS